MALDRPQLERRLAALDKQLPGLLEEHQAADDFWAAFAGLADDIADAAGPEDFDWVQEQLDAMLTAHGASPGGKFSPAPPHPGNTP